MLASRDVGSDAAQDGSAAVDMVADLSRPTAYPEPRPAEVAVATTHASWVFLTGGEAWKVKRPVNHGFLDYGDAKKRRACCQDEVTLGARLAPDVYRGIAPVYHGPAGFTFTGPGEIADTAVRMRRLPDEESARSLVRAGALGPAHIRSLCDRLAIFYRSAARADARGGPAALLALIEENHQQTLPFCDRFVPRDQVERLHLRQKQAVETHHALLRRRVREGFVREGHGDLRLEHVYFPSGRPEAPLVIDPIEFNTGFRCQDAALDVAFLAMELEAEGRGDLAAYAFARFARASNDYSFFRLADLYSSYRASVRAKVACLVAADPGCPPEKSRMKAAEAARLFSLAEALIRLRQGRRTLFVVGGMIGAGKSTVAELLGLALRAPVLSSDVTRKGLAGLPPDQAGDAALYAERVATGTYREMLHRAEQVLLSSRDVILDGTFRTARFRRAARALATRLGCRFLFLAVDADDATLRSRLGERAGQTSISDAREDLLPWLRRRYEPPVELHADELLPVDGRAPTEAIVVAVQAWLRDAGRT
jgi:aminoglycoside phosphotransferase family enzyme/predicted kinase